MEKDLKLFIIDSFLFYLNYRTRVLVVQDEILGLQKQIIFFQQFWNVFLKNTHNWDCPSDQLHNNFISAL